MEEEFQARRGARLNPNQPLREGNIYPTPDQQPDFEQTMVDDIINRAKGIVAKDPRVQFIGGALGGIADAGKRFALDTITPMEPQPYEPMFNPDSMFGDIGRSFVGGFTGGYPEGPLDEAMSPIETALTFADAVDPTNVLGDVAKAAPAILKSAPSPDLMGYASRVIPVDNIAGMAAGLLPLQAKKFFKNTVATTDYETTGKLGLPSKTQEPLLVYHGGTTPINEVKSFDPVTGQALASTGSLYSPGFYLGQTNTAKNFALYSGKGPQFIPEFDLLGRRSVPGLTPVQHVSQGANITPVYLNVEKVQDMNNLFTDTRLLDEVLAMAETYGADAPIFHKINGLSILLSNYRAPFKGLSTSMPEVFSPTLIPENIVVEDQRAIVDIYRKLKANPQWQHNTSRYFTPSTGGVNVDNFVDDMIRKYTITNNNWWEFGEGVGMSMIDDMGTSRELLMDILQNQGYDGQTYMLGPERAWVSLPDVNEIETIIKDVPMYGSYRERVVPYAMAQSKDIFDVPSAIPEKMEQFYSKNPFR